MIGLMDFSKFLKSDVGRKLMSVILGLGLATVLRERCKGKRCNYITSPPFEEINSKTFRFEEKCYKYQPEAVSCDNSKTTYQFIK